MNKLSSIAIVIILFTIKLTAQVSHNSGFYTADSLFWEYKQAIAPGHKLQIAVNKFGKNDFKTYSGGVWLKNRNDVANSWENGPFVKGPNRFGINPNLTRGNTNKVNVVRIRILDAQNKVKSENVYFIGVGASINGMKGNPHIVPVVHLFVTEEDAFGPEGFYGPGKGLAVSGLHAMIAGTDTVWNYAIDMGTGVYNHLVPRERIEKACFAQIIDTTGKIRMNQKVGVRVSGNTSTALANKSFGLVGRKEYGDKRIRTDIFGVADTFSRLIIRSGGSGQLLGMASNEIAHKVIKGINSGESDNQMVVVYLNGSYWSISWIQNKLDEYLIEKQYNVDHDTVDIVDAGYYFEKGSMEDSIVKKITGKDSAKVCYINSSASSSGKLFVGLTEKGKGKEFLSAATTLNQLLEQSNFNSYSTIQNTIDIDSWLKYLAVIDFLRMDSAIDNDALVVTFPGQKPFIAFKDFDFSCSKDPKGNHWQQTVNLDYEYEFLKQIMLRLILKDKGCQNRLMLVYQDLLNTNFKPAQCARMAHKMYDELLAEFPTYYSSWGANGTRLTYNQYLDKQTNIFTYFIDRHKYAGEIMMQQFQPNENYTSNDLKPVRVVIDPAIKGKVKVKLNSLTIDSTWEGEYYPKPHIEVELVAPQNMKVIWKEYPDSSRAMKLSSVDATVLTPVLVAINTDLRNDATPDAPVKIYPNPATERAYIQGDNIKETEVYNVLGEQVLKTTENSFSVNGLSPGNYIAKMNGYDGNITIQKMAILCYK